MKTRIIVTGAGSFLGSRICRYYEKQFDIIAMDHHSLDVTDKNNVDTIINQTHPDLIIHLASITSTEECEKNPEKAYRVNVQGTKNIVVASQNAGAKLVFMSSEQVFNGNTDDGPYDEHVLAVPNTIYGKTKKEAEDYIVRHCENAVILRLNWIFGMPEKGFRTTDNIFFMIIKAALKNECLYINPNEYRGMTYCYDLIANLSKAFDLYKGIYHFGSYTDESRINIAKYICKECGFENRIDDLIRPIEKSKRDLRMSMDKIHDAGIYFCDSFEGISRCAKDYSLYENR